MNESNIVKASDSTMAQQQFEAVKEKIFNLIRYAPKSESETKLLNKTILQFVNESSSTFAAYADFDYDYFEFTDKYKHKIVYNVATMNDNTYLFIHELAHIICIHYGVNQDNQSGAHCLEFAIITYCIQWKTKYQHTNIHKCFLKSYDIHEDKSYPNLSINPSQFNAFIKSIEWTTLEDLVFEAKRLAKIIRTKSVR